jgi:hypothetical protein
MKFKVMLAATLAVALSAPAVAGNTDESNAQQAPKEKKICRTETVTGSLVSKRRVCLTKAEWDQLSQQARDSVNRFTSRSTGTPGTTSNPLAAQ